MAVGAGRGRTGRRARCLVLPVAAALALGACGAGGPATAPGAVPTAARATQSGTTQSGTTQSGTTQSGGIPTPVLTATADPSTSTRTATTPGRTTAEPVVTKLLVVVVENHSLAQMRAAMPYTYSVARRYGYAGHYTATRHPSLPNYLAVVSGSTQGVADDDDPSAHRVRGRSVFGAALAHGRTAGVYLDAMATACQQHGSGRYAVKHNPWAYFVDERDSCARHDLPLAAFDAAARSGTLPDAGMLVPDLCHDAHDCSLATADRWFRARMEQVLAGPDWRAGRLAVVLTADEDDRMAGNRVLTVVAHPGLSHVVVRTPLTHYSLTRLYAEVTGTTPLGAAVQAPSMAAEFGLPVR